MNSSALHLYFNHIPIAGMLILSLLFAYAYLTKRTRFYKALIFSFFIMALFLMVGFLTGEDAKENLSHIPGIKITLIDHHEKISAIGYFLMETLGIICLLYFLFRWKKPERIGRFPGVIFFLSIVVTGVLGYAGYLGLKIRHFETQSDVIVCEPKEVN